MSTITATEDVVKSQPTKPKAKPVDLSAQLNDKYVAMHTNRTAVVKRLYDNRYRVNVYKTTVSDVGLTNNKIIASYFVDGIIGEDGVLHSSDLTIKPR